MFDGKSDIATVPLPPGCGCILKLLVVEASAKNPIAPGVPLSSPITAILEPVCNVRTDDGFIFNELEILRLPLIDCTADTEPVVIKPVLLISFA